MITGRVEAPAMAVISLKLTETLDAQLTEEAHRRRMSKSELVRRALTAFLQSSEQGMEDSAPQSAADLVGCCEGGPADLSSNPAYLSDFGTNSL
jgi:Arc/MetJ-type ribon-helix-helix transcriptional regulator